MISGVPLPLTEAANKTDAASYGQLSLKPEL